jgi:hypothetical protein
LHWLSRAAIDIVGLAGFDYDFNTLQAGETGNELSAAIHTLNSPKRFPLMVFLKGRFPFFRMFEFDEQSRQAKRTRALLREIGIKLIAEKERGTDKEKGGQLDGLDTSEYYFPTHSF